MAAQRENLGLVELLRERPDVVCCIDASGEPPGSFQTLARGRPLAAEELGVDVDVPLDELRGGAGALPLDCAAEGTIGYPAALGGGTGRLLYGRYQLSEDGAAGAAPVRAAHPTVPPRLDRTTACITDGEHDQLVALGEHVGGESSVCSRACRPSIGRCV